ncbi:hypothetical protein GCM10010266_41020 [Streptomyces griseomycini]|nr:hypothetical protein GCM10010266_41020 [Streptomyces griseomycini]GGR23703.1 hypothetical protein GCM10015536_31680 [Streptomyces griseomycini]
MGDARAAGVPEAGRAHDAADAAAAVVDAPRIRWPPAPDSVVTAAPTGPANTSLPATPAPDRSGPAAGNDARRALRRFRLPRHGAVGAAPGHRVRYRRAPGNGGEGLVTRGSHALSRDTGWKSLT